MSPPVRPMPSEPPSPATSARALRALATRLSASPRPCATVEELGDRLLEEGLQGFTLVLTWRCLREACTGSPDMLPGEPYRFRLWWQGASVTERAAALERAAVLAEGQRQRAPSLFARLPPRLAGTWPVRFLDSLTWPVEDSAAWCLLNHLLQPVAEHSGRARVALLETGSVPGWLAHEARALLALLRLPVRASSWRLAARLLLGEAEERAALARQFVRVRQSLGFTE